MLVQLYKGGIDNYGFRICIYGQHAKDVIPDLQSAHSRKRLCTVFQGPNSGCKSRHGAPVFIIHRIALNIRRSSLRLRPLVSVPAFANIGPIMAHFSSEMSCLLMEKQKQRTDEKSRFYLETAPRPLTKNALPKNHRQGVFYGCVSQAAMNAPSSFLQPDIRRRVPHTGS